MISSKQYAIALYDSLENEDNRDEVKKIVKNFTGLVMNNNDLLKFDDIIDEFNKIWFKKQGIVNVKIVSARKLSYNIFEMLNNEIIKLSKAKKLNIKNLIDKNILGGVIIKFNNIIIDYSLNGRLQKLKSKII